MAMQVDPVCGMQIDESEAVGYLEHKGNTYFFCSVACQRKFEENPEKYANQPIETPRQT